MRAGRQEGSRADRWHRRPVFRRWSRNTGRGTAPGVGRGADRRADQGGDRGVSRRAGRRARRGGDRGVATVWVAVTATGLCTVFAAVLALGQAVAARHRAGGAADLAALAAADRALEGAVVACETARKVAVAQGAGLVRCTMQGEIADVTTRSAFGPYEPAVRARAGPPADFRAGLPTDTRAGPPANSRTVHRPIPGLTHPLSPD
ncbi:Rv3654c family TadE-like protein [Streptomyces sp. NPDC091649]|uniref:Rv3654c family TadE-like protein n=1 Tax=Streptomyces sp. NPDC091649 TaxID=3366004 RepID=UPI003810A742